jgi:hypothetical protein
LSNFFPIFSIFIIMIVISTDDIIVYNRVVSFIRWNYHDEIFKNVPILISAEKTDNIWKLNI